MEAKERLTARMERVYTADGKHIVTVWAESVDCKAQTGESYLGMRDRTEPMRISAQQQTFDRARLFAAAPDLLEALILLEAEMVLSGNAGATDYGWKPAIEKTRAAIAKATGD
jgi:hypothetical protein